MGERGSRERAKRERARRLAKLLERGTRDHYLDPLLYDFEYGEQIDDVEWYRSVAKQWAQGLPILELGAGSGRVTIPLAADGHRLIALDRMMPMLEHLELKLERMAQAGESPAGPIELLGGDMLDIPLADQSVGMVIAPFNCLMHLYQWSELLTCFREAYRVLRPGGCFALDVLLPDLEWLQWDPDVRHAVTDFRHPRTGQRMIYSTNHRYDPDSQVCHIRIYYDERSAHPGGQLHPEVEPVETVHLAHRQIYPEELRMLAGVAGFEIELHSGDFLDLTLNADVETQNMICRRPA